MSDENELEDETPQEQPRERTLTVKVEKTPEDDEVRIKAERFDQLVSGMADTLNQKYDTTVFSGKTLEEMKELDELLSSRQGKPKPSTGVVSLYRKQETDNLLTKAFEDPKQYVDMIKEHANNPNSPIFEEAQEALRILQEQTFADLPRTTEVTVGQEREAVEDLGRNFAHEQYTEWLRRKEAHRLSGKSG